MPASHSLGMLTRIQQGGLDLVSFSRRQYQTHYITARPSRAADPLAVFTELADVVRAHGASIASQTVFGDQSLADSGLAALQNTFGDITWPVTWLNSSSQRLGTQVSALSGIDVTQVKAGGRVVGSAFEDDHARYCFLGNLASPDVSGARAKQVSDTFRSMDAILGKMGMGFEHVLRTWLYIDSILDWYGELNSARTRFFEEHNIFEHMMPASTGIGVSNLAGRAVVAECIAMQPKSPAVRVHEVESPLQCKASDYKSSFSRAVEVVTPDHRRLYVSGTASIGADGTTVHSGDVEAQIARTMEVVHAILLSKNMDWDNVTRGVAYFRDIADIPTFVAYCENHAIPRGVLLETPAVVCRDDLLFELEANGIAL
ncbi:MAG: endoribonuclease L-PSP [Gemmatimonadota bacterium]|nr:MAG: endoribonuclease L-PSP [Gemmatimonadota bacterium]